MVTGAENETGDERHTGASKKVRMATEKQRRGRQEGWPTVWKRVGATENVDAGVPIKAPHHHPLTVIMEIGPTLV